MISLRQRVWLPFLLAVFIVLAGCGLFSPSSQPIPPLITTPPPDSAYRTLDAFLVATVPDRDLVALTERFKGVDVPLVAQTEATEYRMGQIEMFWFKNQASGRNEQIEARLVYRSAGLNLWVELNQRINVAETNDAAATLENVIFPAVRDLFGMEWQPGVEIGRAHV